MCWFLLRKASVLSSSRNDCWCVCLVLSKYECIEHVWWNNCNWVPKQLPKIKKEKLLFSTNIDAFKKEKKGRRNSLKQPTEFSFFTMCLAVSFISNAIWKVCFKPWEKQRKCLGIILTVCNGAKANFEVTSYQYVFLMGVDIDTDGRTIHSTKIWFSGNSNSAFVF